MRQTALIASIAVVAGSACTLALPLSGLTGGGGGADAAVEDASEASTVGEAGVRDAPNESSTGDAPFSSGGREAGSEAGGSGPFVIASGQD